MTSVWGTDPADCAALDTFLLRAKGPFSHQEHLRVARLYLQQLPLGEAIDRFWSDLRRFAETNGAAGKAHLTISVALLLWIRSALATAPSAESFEGFVSRNPGLLDRELLSRYYAPATLASDHARRDFVFPDLGGRSPG